VKPSAKPSTQPRQIASRTGFLFRSLSMLEQTSKNSLPDLLTSGCSAVLSEPALPDEQTMKAASSPRTDSKRMEPPSVGRFYFRFRIPEKWNHWPGWPGKCLVRRLNQEFAPLSNRTIKYRPRDCPQVASFGYNQYGKEAQLGGIQDERESFVSKALLSVIRRSFHLCGILGPSRFMRRCRPPIRFEHCDTRCHGSRSRSASMCDVPAKTFPAGKLSAH
jgi:hypothetical protein